MFNTGQAMEKLINGRLGISFIMVQDKNIHIFKCVDGRILIGEYGNGAIEDFTYWSDKYKDAAWIVDFEGSVSK